MIKVCGWCKKKFVTDRMNQNYCGPECSAEAKLKYQREYEAKKKKKEKANKKPKRKVNELTSLAIEARAAGMTYGQYVAQKNMQFTKIQRKEQKNEDKRE